MLFSLLLRFFFNLYSVVFSFTGMRCIAGLSIVWVSSTFPFFVSFFLVQSNSTHLFSISIEFCWNKRALIGFVPNLVWKLLYPSFYSYFQVCYLSIIFIFRSLIYSFISFANFSPFPVLNHSRLSTDFLTQL